MEFTREELLVGVTVVAVTAVNTSSDGVSDGASPGSLIKRGLMERRAVDDSALGATV